MTHSRCAQRGLALAVMKSPPPRAWRGGGPVLSSGPDYLTVTDTGLEVATFPARSVATAVSM
jgi:hypothetical protein